MNEIRFATRKDLKALRSIWHAAFPQDTAADCDGFLKIVHLDEECVVACVDGKPVSMAFFLPAVLRTDDTVYTVRYLYAASTLPAYRGQGIFSELLNTALSWLKSRGIAACFLNPAEESLIGYYRRFGFEPAFFSHTLRGLSHMAQMPLSPLSDTAYLALRQANLPPDRVEWDERWLRYVLSYATALRVGEKACVLFQKNGDELRVLELLNVPEDQKAVVCSALAWHQGCTAFCARTASDGEECFGMLLPLAQPVPMRAFPYMGLALD